MSRAHYALVRKVESATPQATDQILLAEVHSIRNQLARSTLTLVSEVRRRFAKLVRRGLMLDAEAMQGMSGTTAILRHDCQPWRISGPRVCSSTCDKSCGSRANDTEQADGYVTCGRFQKRG